MPSSFIRELEARLRVDGPAYVQAQATYDQIKDTIKNTATGAWAAGLSARSIAELSGIPRTTIISWMPQPNPAATRPRHVPGDGTTPSGRHEVWFKDRQEHEHHPPKIEYSGRPSNAAKSVIASAVASLPADATTLRAAKVVLDMRIRQLTPVVRALTVANVGPRRIARQGDISHNLDRWLPSRATTPVAKAPPRPRRPRTP